jgi:hypothetical protein
MENTNKIEELGISNDIETSNISKSYSEIKIKIPPNEICLILSQEFEKFYYTVKSKSIEDKCISFQLFRQQCHSTIYNMYFNVNLNENDYFIQNALFDYIDCSLSMLFFRNQFDLNPINTKVDNDFYFALLPFAIDRIEFPSLVKDEIQASLKMNNRLSVPLKRRNFLANLMIGSRNYVMQVIEKTVNHHKKMPTFFDLEKICRKHKSQYFNFVCNRTSQIEKMMNKQKNDDNTYTIYRGYDIDAKEDVIINRKIRLQDANKSYSFTANTDVAKMFANYKHRTIDDDDVTTYDDRVNLVSSFIDLNKIDCYKNKSNRKYVFAKYKIDEKDIIFMPFQTTTTECEVFANPDNAKLIRYEIVYSS